MENNMDLITHLPELAHWQSREVKYIAGPWAQIRGEIPEFELSDFTSGVDEPPNPFLRTVCRLPNRSTERPIPVGIVSNKYSLVQHREIGDRCVAGMKLSGIDTVDIKSELGLSELSEWMNLRIYFPEEYSFMANDGHNLDLRLECFNSVEGSSRLKILLGWFRIVCLNGMIIGETLAEIDDIHNEQLDLDEVFDAVQNGIDHVQGERLRLEKMQQTPLVDWDAMTRWVDGNVTAKWGKKAACRVFHICKSGSDVEIADPFAKGAASEKPVRQILRVPGSPEKSKNIFDVMQALSWVATNRNNAEQRLSWQIQVPALIEDLALII
jgi:hypothetical protein